MRLKPPTDKQFNIRKDSIRSHIVAIINQIDDLQCWGNTALGKRNRHLLRTALEALKISESQLLEIDFERE